METTRHTKLIRPRRGGISVLEIVVSAAILGMIGVVTLQGVAAVHMSHMDTVDSSRAHLLARDLMDEILLNGFFGSTQNGSLGGDPVTRENFGTISDYDGWNSAGDLAPQYKDGTLIDVGPGWARKVTIRNVENDNITFEAPGETTLKEIVVDVYRNDKKLASLTAIRSLSWKSAQTLE